MSKPAFIFSANHAKKIADEKNSNLGERELAYQSLKPVFEKITEQMNKGKYCIEIVHWMKRVLSPMEFDILEEEKFTIGIHYPEYNDPELREIIYWKGRDKSGIIY